MPRWAAKVDSTHAIVVAALRAHGWIVISLARLGPSDAADDRCRPCGVRTAEGLTDERVGRLRQRSILSALVCPVRLSRGLREL